MPENELIIRHKGRDYDIELTESDADRFSNLTAVIEHAPFDKPRPTWPSEGSELPKRQIAERTTRRDEYERRSANLQSELLRIAKLDQYKMPVVLAFIDLLELGDVATSEDNWMVEFIEQLLNAVIYEGPAGALHRDPRPLLAGLAHDMYMYWSSVRDVRDAAARHPEIFPAPHSAPAERKAAAQRSTTSTPAKPRRARKRAKAA